ncbi:SIR2 family NAD-dependent protein deacylase [Bacillus paranthracis]|uniref:SIR2 family NAD-dependent protein deacylase n=1 Tax=Bacillus paranthracis TaxID=2026186 RepID=UPI003D64671C
MSTKNIDQFFKKGLSLYPHLKVIRDNLWSKDGKSRVSVMIGAGFSMNARKIESSFSEMALWDDLREKLASNLSHHPDVMYKDVLEVGQLYVDEYGRTSLDEILKDAIPDDNYEPDLLHQKLLNLPWADVFTTNYDTLLERTKKNVYERNYQIIYDINDIPRSTAPRIIKLHGSFPSNRPFIFTKNDYDSYPEKFSPFVNMVQQSIMETTFVLLGFSGDDPNFEKWTTWVRNNLGEQMPKIYMIGYGQKHRQGELRSKGITLIDFKDIYSSEKEPYHAMFTDIFEFLAYKDRNEKTQWPHQSYVENQLSLETLEYNRKTYPGWAVMPNEIRRTHALYIRLFSREKIDEISDLTINEQINYINEILWCFEKFYIPLDPFQQEKFKNLIKKLGQNLNEKHTTILFSLLKEARLDCNKKEFEEYRELLSKLPLDLLQRHQLTYEQILFNIALNNINQVLNYLKHWDVGEKEIEWGIKKSAILMRVGQKTAAKINFENYLQTIRRLLAIQSDDYRLLSLESVALNILQRINNKWDYGYDRLRNLSSKNCNTSREFYQTLTTLNVYENKLGTTEIQGFDPGNYTITTKYGDYITKEILDSFAVLQIHEMFETHITKEDRSQYTLALTNLKILYPLYCQIKQIYYADTKEIYNIFSREFVYQLNNDNLEILLEMLKETISHESNSVIDVDIALEIISRIYFALPSNRKSDIDLKVINFMDNKVNYTKYHKFLKNFIRRALFDKNQKEKKIFYKQLIETDIHSQWHPEEYMYTSNFFDPFLVDVPNQNYISNLKVSENIVLKLLNQLGNSEDQSIREGALIRMTFLQRTGSLTVTNQSIFIELLQGLPSNRRLGKSDFIYEEIFNEILNSRLGLSEEDISIFLDNEIPIFYAPVDQSYFNTNAFYNYFNKLSYAFSIYKHSHTLNAELYIKWLSKLYVYWESQREGLLRSINKEPDALGVTDYLKRLVSFLEKNFLGIVPITSLRDIDYTKLKGIFKEIDKKRPDLSLLLVPCLERLNIKTGYKLENIVNNLKSKDVEKVRATANTLYNYLILIENQDLMVDKELIKDALLNIFYYGTEDIFTIAVDTLRDCMENIPKVFSENECLMLINFYNDYLNTITSETVNISTLKGFSQISSFAGLVAYTYKYQNALSQEALKEWKSYISSHKLPEVRKYSDVFSS